MNEITVDQQILQKAIQKNYSSELISSLNIPKNEIEQRFKYYYSIPQPAQKSQAWLDQRTNYITASAFGIALSPKGIVARNDLLKNKVSNGAYNTFFGNEATRWGEKYEDVCSEIYCYRNKVEVKDFGLIPHPKYPFIGASTDGITSNLINLEIKSPFSRIIKPGEVKPEYWKQMQLQMDVLDLPLTHFLECSFEEYPNEHDFWINGLTNPEKGIIIEYVNLNINNNDGDPKTMYVYSPVNLCDNVESLKLWYKQNILKIVTSTDQIYIMTHYWMLKKYSCVNVIRDTQWFNEQIPKFMDFWNDVEYYRKNGGMDLLNKDLEELEKLKPNKSKKIKVESPSKTSFILSDEDDNIPTLSKNYILSSSDEDIKKSSNTHKKTISPICLIENSDDEKTDTIKYKDHHKVEINDNNVRKNKIVTCLIESSDDEKIIINVKNKNVTCLIESSDDEKTIIFEMHDEVGTIKLMKRVEESLNNANQISEDISKPKLSKKQISLQKKLDSDDNSSNSSSNCHVFDKEDDDIPIFSQSKIKHKKIPINKNDDGYSSGSETENDSPPMRPPTKEIKKVYRKKSNSPKSLSPKKVYPSL